MYGVCLVAYAASLPLLVVAQERRVFSYTPDTVPPALTLKRGDVVDFTGPGLRDGEEQRFMLRSGDAVRVSATVRGPWRLRYDTRAETYPACVVTLWQMQFNGEWSSKARVKVRIVDEAPLRIVAPVPDMRVMGPLALRIEGSGDDRAERIGYTLDGKPLGLFADHMGEVVWNPSDVSFGRHLLGGIARMQDGSLFTLDAVPVLVTSRLRALPFAVGDTLDLSALNGKIAVRAEIDASIVPKTVTYLVDQQVIARRTEAPFDHAAWNPSASTTGGHKLTIDAEDTAGGHTVSAPFAFSAYRRTRRRAVTEMPFTPPSGTTLSSDEMGAEAAKNGASLESVLLDHKRVTVSTARLPEHLAVGAGTELALTGSFTEAMDIELAAYVDAQRLAGFNGRGKFRLVVPTRTLAPGAHTLKVRLNYASGQTKAVGQVNLLVYEGTPVRLRPIAADSGGRTGLAPVTLQAQFSPDFAPRTLTYYADGRALPNDPVSPQTAQWDPRSCQPGAHSLWAVAWDEDGMAFRSEAVTVTIPVRVRATPPAAPVVVKTGGQKLALDAVIADGIAPVQVTYQIDGVTVATRNSAPFAAACDVSTLPSGRHALIARVRDDNDALYVSAAAPLDVQNPAWDAQRARADAALRRKSKGSAAGKANPSPSPLRGPLAKAYQPDPAERDGQVGQARGLAVVFLGRVPVIGRLMNIEASIRPGAGQFTFEAAAEPDTQSSARRALEFAHKKALQRGQNLDWEHTDAFLRHPDTTLRTQGTSAGVADAVALVSACLQMPVDHSVAVTGALGEDGQILPVGGILQKMEAVFNDPTIRALVLPAGSLAESDLVTLTVQRPEILAQRRIILAHNMEEVLRQLLIGYSDAVDFAEEMAQEGLGFYLNNDRSRALESLRKAHELTPENATFSVWVSLVEASGTNKSKNQARRLAK